MNSKVKRLIQLIKDVYDQPNGGCGGGLHIVVEDWNIEDHNIQWCLDQEITAIERECGNELLNATIEERNSALYCERQ